MFMLGGLILVSLFLVFLLCNEFASILRGFTQKKNDDEFTAKDICFTNNKKAYLYSKSTKSNKNGNKWSCL